MSQKQKVIGVWLDFQTAVLIGIAENSDPEAYQILKKIHRNGHILRSGNEHISKVGKHTEIKKYFKELADELLPYTDILLFGPGQVQEELFNFLLADRHFNGKIISNEATGNLTERQLIAFVRNFFKRMV